MKNSKQLLFTILFLSLFIVGSVSATRTYPNTKMTGNQYLTTADGVQICYDVYEPDTDTMIIKNAVILGHGIAVNKEVMKLMAQELASAGFVAISIDFRGHGRSNGDMSSMMEGGATSQGTPESFSNLLYDVLAAKEYLANRGDINMTNLGYIGYSMGGGVGFELLAFDSDFRAFVGLAPVPDFENTNATHPPNMLILVSEFDEAISMDGLYKVMENRTGLGKENLENNKLYGTFEDGTASKLYLVQDTEHFFAPYHEPFVKETRDWFYRALMGSSISDEPLVGYLSTLLLTGLATVSGILFLAFFANTLYGVFQAKIKENQESVEYAILEQKEKKRLLPKAILLGTLGLLPFLLLFLMPFMFANVIIILFGGPAFALYFSFKRHGKRQGYDFKQEYLHPSPQSLFIPILFGIIVGLVGYVVVVFSIGNLLGAVPHVSELPWMVPYGIVILFIFYTYNYSSEKVSQFFRTDDDSSFAKKYIKDFLINAAVCSIPVTIIILIFSVLASNFFLAMILLLAIPLVAFISLISTTMKHTTHEFLSGSIFTMVVLTPILITLTPFMNLIAMLL